MNLPSQFIDRTKPLLGEEWKNFAQSLEKEAVTSIRINPAKCPVPELNLENVLWNKTGYYLPVRPTFTFDPLFHCGCYYPQEASSMFLGEVLRQYADSDMRVLDLCAAPGGKSTHTLSLLPDDSLLVSNEVIRTRVNILAENIAKWGYSNSIVTNNDPSELGKIKEFFDIIIVDAPCSGEGMFRKDETAVSEWSESNVRLCKERQQRILSDIWPALKPDGILIYSTCTYNTDENEDNVEWMRDTLDATPVNVNIPSEWNVTGALKGNLPVYRFLPHKTKGEGFFLAVVKKESGDGLSENRQAGKRREKNNKSKQRQLASQYKQFLRKPESFSYFQRNETWHAIPSLFENDLNRLSENLRIISAGVELGEIKGKDFVPSQALALSCDFDASKFPECKVSWQDAISFLRRDAIFIDNSYPKGYILLTYKNVPLGFVKNIGNRTNNLYPQEWRIRTSNIPESFEAFL